ncbi:protein of unknown function [Candidatus Nitrosacidococcus tergens]|uniref:Uncharacterized protein n=1 Tax=Candidatus Nitrosacidococcus tergens TaxID=553981 RepID=A0A7G1QBB6_9GAMM|nr:protein of unknown function [Candidatus Nitrosacidococcus tergens]
MRILRYLLHLKYQIKLLLTFLLNFTEYRLDTGLFLLVGILLLFL